MRPTSLLSVAGLLAVAFPAAAQSLQFTTGIDGAVEVPFDAAMVPPTGLTVEAWITYDDSTIPTGLYYWPTIARQNIAAGQESWILRVGASNTNNRNVEFTVRNGLNQLNVLTYTFAPGELAVWTHLAATYDGQVMRLFKNGVQVSTRTLTTAYDVQNSGGILRIGNGDAVLPGRETWNGQIDELRVWPMPRTAQEIAETMNQELMLMPGKVLTFNCNGTYVDSSLGLIGTAVGAVAFGPGAPGLTMAMPVALNLGQSTTTCARTIDTALGSVPVVGNTAFRVWCTKAPLPANAPLGLVVAAGRSAPLGQPPFFGVNLVFDLTTVLNQAAFLPGTSGRGIASLPLPIPNNPRFVGTSLVIQFGFQDTQCGPAGFSASDGVGFTVQ